MANVNAVGLMTNKEIAKLLAERIQKERRVKNMDQQTLADKAGLPLSAIRTLEQTGNIALPKLITVLRALGRVNVFVEMFDFDLEYKNLPYDEYQKIVAKQNAGYIRKSSKDVKEEW